jgi:hypothetical protein
MVSKDMIDILEKAGFTKECGYGDYIFIASDLREDEDGNVFEIRTFVNINATPPQIEAFKVGDIKNKKVDIPYKYINVVNRIKGISITKNDPKQMRLEIV